MSSITVSITRGANRAMLRARQEARALRQETVGTEHLLLGLFETGGDPALRALASVGVTPARVRTAVRDRFGEGHSKPSKRQLRLSAENQQVVRSARVMAFAFSVPMASKHLLFHLLKDQGSGASLVLRDLGVDPTAVRLSLTPEIFPGPVAPELLAELEQPHHRRD